MTALKVNENITNMINLIAQETLLEGGTNGEIEIADKDKEIDGEKVEK